MKVKMDNNKTLYDLKISINGAFKKDEIISKKRNIIDRMIKMKCFETFDIVYTGYTTLFQRCDTRFIRSMDLI